MKPKCTKLNYTLSFGVHAVIHLSGQTKKFFMEALSNYDFLHERTEMSPPCKYILLGSASSNTLHHLKVIFFAGGKEENRDNQANKRHFNCLWNTHLFGGVGDTQLSTTFPWGLTRLGRWTQVITFGKQLCFSRCIGIKCIQYYKHSMTSLQRERHSLS